MKIRRIVTGFGVGPDSAAILAAVAALAAVHDAELEALFVEGDDLARFAALPFARELGFPSAARRPLDPQSVERSLQARALQARHRLAARSGRTDPRWSFRAARGSLADALLAASPNADLVVVGNRPWDPGALQVVRAGIATLLVLPAGARVEGPLIGTCSTTVPVAGAVQALCALADAIGDGLSILVAGPRESDVERWVGESREALRRFGRDAPVARLGREQSALLAKTLAHGPGVLALMGADAALGDAAVTAMLASARVPVFVCAT